MTIVFGLNYSLSSIPSGTGRLDCQDVAVELNSQSAQIHHNDTVPDIASYHGTMSLYKGVIPLGGLERTIFCSNKKGTF
ncbi:hypothetical protein N657DRAFT_361566 [Parathielavia appendiculata]|uniref:Uncharacterized protein n=1 Tax=Parathielavia appendiculata TaxID=2587402 RepID=A0AAN6Z4T7_9PEZI|nr:hypothetical protein N657DRAFT_361566 [Parathielavia appendiculata]